ncbi:MgtC/SapB family protein [Halorutilales archaeon Cl-col2-1]
MDLPLAAEFLVAVGVGGMIGIEREKSVPGHVFAGSRTHPLVALLGATLNSFFPGILWVGFSGVVVLATLGYIFESQIEETPTPGTETNVENNTETEKYRGTGGITTSVSTLLTFVYGGMATQSEEGLVVSVILGTITMAILAAKKPIHSFAGSLGEEELFNASKFLIVALVVLPILPDRNLDSLLGLNPRFIWTVVVLVSGISFSAYLLTQVVGAQRGLSLTGILGGFVSSTPTTVSMANRAKINPGLTNAAGFAASIASVTMFPRMLIEISVVNTSLLFNVGIPIAGMAVVGLGLSVILYFTDVSGKTPEVDLENPFRLKPALAFGVFFAIILLISENASQNFGDLGVYATAFFSGLMDVDSITISLSKLALEGDIQSDVAANGIVIGAITNTLVKIGIAVALGTARLGIVMAKILIPAVATGLVLVFVV